MNSTKIIFFDVETTGLPKHWTLSLDTIDSMPYIVQMSWIVYQGGEMREEDYIIKVPEGVVIKEESIKIHKITNEISKTKGIDIRVVLAKFIKDMEGAEKIVAHNLKFDKLLVRTEASRNGMYREVMRVFRIVMPYCTMYNGIALCKLPKRISQRKTIFKYPKLIELYTHLFGEDIPDNVIMHNSLYDCRIGLRCYLEMTEKSQKLRTTH
jgi:DNA polymerase III epsilon subunit-like protein